MKRKNAIKYYLPVGDWPLDPAPYHEMLHYIGFTEGDFDSAHLLVLPGGTDIGLRPDRDDVESYAFRTWRKRGLPLLGICRGMQLALHLSGERLIPHLPDVHSDILHTANGGSSWHTSECGLLLNSRHHQGFDRIGNPTWQVLDTTSDGVIEAVADDRSLLLQWHPERQEMRGGNAFDWFMNRLGGLL